MEGEVVASRPVPRRWQHRPLDIRQDDRCCRPPRLPSGFSLAVSGMMMPPAVFSSSSTRRIRTRSCNGRNFIGRISLHHYGAVRR